MDTEKIASVVRIKEREIDAIFADAFSESTAFCDLVRKNLRLDGYGLATRVAHQACHFEDTGSIDLDVDLFGIRLLVENKIGAYWSHTQLGVAQPERYVRSSRGFNAQSVLIAPRSYIKKSLKAQLFDHAISYESLLPAFTGEKYEILCNAIDQAEVPPENPSHVQTVFFQEFSQFMKQVAPQIAMKQRDRNEGSHTVHIDIRRSLRLHADLPKPKVFLQLVEANVKLMIPRWGWSISRLLIIGGLEGTGITLRQVGRVGTLALQLPSPQINCLGLFEAEQSKAEKAILATAQLCSWWDENPNILRRWQSEVMKTGDLAASR